VTFTVPAYPDETFSAAIARIAHSMSPNTRSMAVELDVANPGGRLAPSMYPTVSSPVTRARASLFIPATSIVTTTERTFVIRVRDGVAEWVNVRRGASDGESVEIFGALDAGDLIVRRASDELREGSRVNPRSRPS